MANVLVDQRIQQRATRRGEMPLADQQFAQRRRLVVDPGLHPGDELRLREKIHLQGENAEQKITIRRSAHIAPM
ncbi:MAG: hypothetical protein QM811_12590 [Pirellulales bacterium]